MYVGNMYNAKRVQCIRMYSVNACVPQCVTHPSRAVNVILYKIGSSGSSTSRRTTLALRMKPDLQKYGARVFRVFGTFSPLSRSTSRSILLALSCHSFPFSPSRSLSRSVSISLAYIQTHAYRCTFSLSLSRYLILSRKLVYSRVCHAVARPYLHPKG